MGIWIIVDKENEKCALPFAFPNKHKAESYRVNGPSFHPMEVDNYKSMEIDESEFEDRIHEYRLTHPN